MADRHMLALWGTRTACAVLSAQFIGAVGEADAPAALDIDGMARCIAIRADEPRLACYDALAHGFGLLPPAPNAADPAARKGQPPSAGTNPPPGDQEKLFGLSKPLEPVAHGPESLQAIVAQLSADSLGNVVMMLDNGQNWAFDDANALLRKGDSVVIKRAALGSFIMTTPSNRTYRVRRIK